jgi:hypothetical protein
VGFTPPESGNYLFELDTNLALAIELRFGNCESANFIKCSSTTLQHYLTAGEQYTVFIAPYDPALNLIGVEVNSLLVEKLTEVPTATPSVQPSFAPTPPSFSPTLEPTSKRPTSYIPTQSPDTTSRPTSIFPTSQPTVPSSFSPTTSTATCPFEVAQLESIVDAQTYLMRNSSSMWGDLRCNGYGTKERDLHVVEFTPPVTGSYIVRIPFFKQDLSLEIRRGNCLSSAILNCNDDLYSIWGLFVCT